jgi:hypothetical protein
MNRIKSLRFPVKGVGGFNLTFSEVFVVVVSVFSAIVICHLSRCQSFIFGVKVSGVVESRFRGVRVSGCTCKDTGAFVGESTLLLDFEMLKKNV